MKAAIHIEAAGTFEEQVDFRAADPERLRGGRIVEVSFAYLVSPIGHVHSQRIGDHFPIR